MSLTSNLSDLATRVATECKALRTLINNNGVDLSALSTTAKGNLVAALNELKTAVDAVAGIIDDEASTSSTVKTWSVAKIVAEISAKVNAAIDDLANGAPAALDTLKELSTAIGDDPDFAATVTAALGNRVRADAAQSFNDTQKGQARTNIGAASAAAVGDTDANFVTVFNAGLA